MYAPVIVEILPITLINEATHNGFTYPVIERATMINPEISCVAPLSISTGDELRNL
jgi:hypothetical protein